MSTDQVPSPSDSCETAFKVLQAAVDETLERNRRLSHYYVVWKDGKIITIGEDAPLDDGNTGQA